MNIFNIPSAKGLAAVLGALMLAACATVPEPPPGAMDARARLTELQSNRQLASRAPVAVEEAEVAVKAAEQPNEDVQLTRHLVFMADRKVAIAWAEAQQRFAEDQRKALVAERDSARLEARTSEADRARGDADLARIDADAARGEAKAARDAARKSQQIADDLRGEISSLNAKATERGLLMTLGDVLFATGSADLKVGQSSNLEKLAAFLKRYEERDVVIEGHTDDVGTVDANLGLSQRRAEAVKAYLMDQGVSGKRLTATGKGEGSPVATNDSPFGRQQNRRVEVIISDPAAAAEL